MIIRDYQSGDFKRLYEIDHSVFAADLAYSYIELRYYLVSRKCRTFVAEQDNAIIGFAIGRYEHSTADLGHLITIDVAADHQRQQVGSRLLEDVERWLWDRGVRAIYLETPIDDSGAKAFYEKHGYFVYDTITGYYNDRLDAFVMMKTDRRH